MDPALQSLLSDLATIVARTTVAGIFDKVKLARKGKRDEQTIEELSDIIKELVDERTKLITISQGLEDALVSRRISDDEVGHIVDTLILLFEELTNQATDPQKQESIERAIDVLKRLVSVEMPTLLHLVGFDFKAAIGYPLTVAAQQPLLNLSTIPDGQMTSARGFRRLMRERSQLLRACTRRNDIER